MESIKISYANGTCIYTIHKKVSIVIHVHFMNGILIYNTDLLDVTHTGIIVIGAMDVKVGLS